MATSASQCQPEHYYLPCRKWLIRPVTGPQGPHLIMTFYTQGPLVVSSKPELGTRGLPGVPYPRWCPLPQMASTPAKSSLPPPTHSDSLQPAVSPPPPELTPSGQWLAPHTSPPTDRCPWSFPATCVRLFSLPPGFNMACGEAGCGPCPAQVTGCPVTSGSRTGHHGTLGTCFQSLRDRSLTLRGPQA